MAAAAPAQADPRAHGSVAERGGCHAQANPVLRLRRRLLPRSSSATFLYAIGFIGNFGVPTTLDGAAARTAGRRPRRSTSACSALFAVQHSVMARKWFKDALDADRPAADRAVDLRPLLEPRADPAVLAVAAAGRRASGRSRTRRTRSLLLRRCSPSAGRWCSCRTFLINHFDLFGLRQVWLYLRGRPYTPLRFGTPGPYRLVRHPLYVGWFFAFWMTPTMTLAHLLFAVATTAYILVAIQFEERRPRARARADSTRSTADACRC